MSIKEQSDSLAESTMNLQGNINGFLDLLKPYLKSPISLSENVESVNAESATGKSLRIAQDRVNMVNDLFDKLFKVLDL